MKKRFIEDKILDEVGSRILERTRLKESEIEKIVSNSKLFDSIKAEIGKEKNRREKFKISGKTPVFTNLNWKKTVLAFGVLLIFSVIFLGMIFSGKNDSSQNALVESAVSPENKREILPVKNLPAPKSDEKEIPNSYSVVKSEKRERKQFLKAASSKQAHKESARKRKQQMEIAKNQEEFYPLTFAGDLYFGEDTKSIVRAEVKSEDLIRMGLNLPIENRNEVFKTEMIVSSDGMPLAVRFIENF